MRIREWRMVSFLSDSKIIYIQAWTKRVLNLGNRRRKRRESIGIVASPVVPNRKYGCARGSARSGGAWANWLASTVTKRLTRCPRAGRPNAAGSGRWATARRRRKRRYPSYWSPPIGPWHSGRTGGSYRRGRPTCCSWRKPGSIGFGRLFNRVNFFSS